MLKTERRKILRLSTIQIYCLLLVHLKSSKKTPHSRQKKKNQLQQSIFGCHSELRSVSRKSAGASAGVSIGQNKEKGKESTITHKKTCTHEYQTKTHGRTRSRTYDIPDQVTGFLFINNF